MARQACARQTTSLTSAVRVSRDKEGANSPSVAPSAPVSPCERMDGAEAGAGGMSRGARRLLAPRIRHASSFNARTPATCAAFHAWLKAGRVVRKGQKGIRIVAPVMGGDDGGKVVTIKPACGVRCDADRRADATTRRLVDQDRPGTLPAGLPRPITLWDRCSPGRDASKMSLAFWPFRRVTCDGGAHGWRLLQTRPRGGVARGREGQHVRHVPGPTCRTGPGPARARVQSPSCAWHSAAIQYALVHPGSARAPS